jgi:AcrB/AcrD/AcrF family
MLPLAMAVGSGAEMRQSLGAAVFSGMLGLTLFGLLFTPIFYVLSRGLTLRGRGSAADDTAATGVQPSIVADRPLDPGGGDASNPSS